MYTNNKVRFILGKIDTSITFEVGVKQGDRVAPVLFLFIMMVFAETIEKEWVRNDLKMIKFKQHSNSPQSSGRTTSHPAKTFSLGTLFQIFCMLYVDDGEFSFETRKDMETGYNLVFKHFNRFGLQMKIGSMSKPSKTEGVFSPAPGHFKLPTPTSTAIPTYSSSSLPITLKQNKENGGKRQKDMIKSTTTQRKQTNSRW